MESIHKMHKCSITNFHIIKATLSSHQFGVGKISHKNKTSSAAKIITDRFWAIRGLTEKALLDSAVSSWKLRWLTGTSTKRALASRLETPRVGHHRESSTHAAAYYVLTVTI